MGVMIYEALSPLVVQAVAAVAVFCIVLMLCKFFQNLF